jgi:3-methyladenine DNA glycosylase AlkC
MTKLKEPGMKDLRLQAYGTMIEKHMIMMIWRNKAKSHIRRHSYLCTRINEPWGKMKHASFNKHYWHYTASMAKNACGFNGRL